MGPSMRREGSDASRSPAGPSLWRRGAEWLGFRAGLLLLGVMLLGGTLIGAGARPFMSASRFRWFLRGWASAIFRGYLRGLAAMGLLRADLADLDRIRDEASLILAPNHPGLHDAVLVISRLPRTVCIMKASLWDNLFLGAGARMAGYIRNDSPRSMVRLSVQALAEGGQLLVFPEGTRSTQAPIGPLKPAFAAIARRAGVPVQTIIIETDSRYLAKGWPLWRKPPLPLRFKVRLGPRVQPDGTVDELVSRVADCFRAELGGAARAAPACTPPSTSSVTPGVEPAAAPPAHGGARLRSDDLSLSMTSARLPVDDR